MIHKTIIERAMRIVRSKLDNIELRHYETISINKDELLHISTALAVASVLCRTNDERNGR